MGYLFEKCKSDGNAISSLLIDDCHSVGYTYLDDQFDMKMVAFLNEKKKLQFSVNK